MTVDFPVMLAPMAGYTDVVMRILARRYYLKDCLKKRLQKGPEMVFMTRPD